MHPDPERFEPERYIPGGSLHTEGILDPFDYSFGFGRRCVVTTLETIAIPMSDEFSSDCRVCPGKGFAEVSMFIFCASMLHTLSFSPPLDEHGKPKELDVYMGSALAVS